MQVDATGAAKRFDRRSGGGINGVEKRARREVDATLVRQRVSPVDQSSIDARAALALPGVKTPTRPTRCGIQRDETQRGGRQVEDPIHHERVALDGRSPPRAHVTASIDPGQLQSPHIVGVDLIGRTVACGGLICAIDRPVVIPPGNTGRGKAHERCREQPGRSFQEEP